MKFMVSTIVMARLVLVFFFMATFFISPVVNATVPNISGTYTGILQGTESSCGIFPGGPFTGGPFPLDKESIILTFTLIDQNTGAFTGSGTASDGATITLTGVIDAAGIVTAGGFTATETGTVTTSGSFGGSQFSGNTFIFSGTGADSTSTPGEDICLSITISTTLTRSGGGNLVIIPEVTNSATLTNVQTLNVQVQGITNEVGSRIGNILRGTGIGFNLKENSVKLEGKANGINAGDGIATGFGAWASYSYSDFENDFVSLAFEGNRHNALMGIDYSPRENMVLGVALGYELSDIDTAINQGNIETDGYSIIPYVGFLINDVLSVDGSFGYTHIRSDQFRTDPGTGAIITSSPDSNRIFGMVNMNGLWLHGNWIFGANAGLLWADNYQEDFFESNGAFVDDQETQLRQYRIGGNIAYTLQEYEPFLSLNYSRDFKMTEITVATGPQPSNDNDDYLFGAGVRYFGNNGVSGNLEYSKRFDRDNFDEDTISLTVRVDY